MAIEIIIPVGGAYQFPTGICDDAENEFVAAAATDLSYIIIRKNGTDFDKIQPGGRVQAPALYHSGTELRVAFQHDVGGWHVSREKYPDAFVVNAGSGDTPPPPPPSGTFTGLDGEVTLVGEIAIKNIKLS